MPTLHRGLDLQEPCQQLGPRWQAPPLHTHSAYFSQAALLIASICGAGSATLTCGSRGVAAGCQPGHQRASSTDRFLQVLLTTKQHPKSLSLVAACSCFTITLHVGDRVASLALKAAPHPDTPSSLTFETWHRVRMPGPPFPAPLALRGQGRGLLCTPSSWKQSAASGFLGLIALSFPCVWPTMG